ncbi:MAG TPA: alpha/beta hydrolase [Solirubrobacteraceae bacterium]|nr:alpha/beta hydrolase [Solirubrobacteraceae bacterium]
MKLRLYHHHDGARIAYREAGTGPPLALLHSAGLSHREWEPLVEELADRFRLVLPDLPLHGDSEDRPRHPYTPDWLAEVVSGFVRDTCGPRPLVGGHETGAQLLLRMVLSGQINPGRVVLMSSSLHRPPLRSERTVRAAARAAGLPGLDRAASHAARLAFRPDKGAALSARGNPSARDLVRHSTRYLGGNPNRARAWSKAVRRWPREQPELLDAYRLLDLPVLLLWADEDASHPLEIAEEALDLVPDALLRVLPGTGFLMAYDDPVGLARELAAFCL